MPKVVDEQARKLTKQRILQEAAREFARLGFDQANINTIAEQAGIGKGTIYLYFENKHELFLAMLRTIAQTHITTIRAALASSGTLQDRLERLYGAFVRLAVQDRASFHVYMSTLYGVNRSFQAEALKLMRDYVAIIALILETSQANGEITCTNIEMKALMILSQTESYVLSAITLGQSEQTLARQAPEVARLILYGLDLPVNGS
jgi:TetR/AcrR family transcriptional regulator, fatty acid metabolism regulator protein